MKISRLLIIALVFIWPALATGQAMNNVKLPAGFKMELYADETLANDIQAMTLDSKGRVVVTGPGYVKILHHDLKTGRASHATTYCTPKTGGMGMWFEGNDLLITAEGWLSRYRDANGDDVADGPPENILPFAFQEHGGHAIRKGPDGWFYVIGGNDAGIDARHIRGLNSPVKDPQAGAIVRLSPDLKQSEVIAHGFRNPYDFDFNAFGDIFTYDSDCERDEFLPWYTPTRVFHVAEGGHHGWRLKGYLRCFARKPDLFDTIGPLADIGRGSPTGVVTYRHHQLPSKFHEGLFILDWTFGKIFFLPLKPSGDSYETKAEVFLEPIGGDGFAPTDMCIGQNASLFVTIGGRKTRGSVYKISYDSTLDPANSKIPAKVRPPYYGINEILGADQPLDAWSRAYWEPKARQLGREAFVKVVLDDERSERWRIRAIEILVDLLDGLAASEATDAWKTATDITRARIAWALARQKRRVRGPLDLPNDRNSPRVQIALAQLASVRPTVEAVPTYNNLIKFSSQRVGPPASELARKLGGLAFIDDHVAAINHALARFRTNPNEETRTVAIQAALRALDDTTLDKPTLTSAVRLIIVALGDWNLEKADADVFTSYTHSVSPEQISPHREAILKAVVPHLGPDGSLLSREAGRLLAMLGDSSPTARETIIASITPSTSATHDIHALIVFDRLTSPVSDAQAKRLAEAVTAIDKKLNGQTGRIKQSWNLRMTELLASYSQKYPQVITTIASTPAFISNTKVDWFTRLAKGPGERVARKFFEEVTKGNKAAITIDDTLFDLFDALPAKEVTDAIRKNSTWADSGPGAIKRLAAAPVEADRATFVKNCDARDVALAEQALNGLERLSSSKNPRDLIPAFSLLRKIMSTPTSKALRVRVASYLSREIGEPALAAEPADAGKLISYYSPLFQAFHKQHPELAKDVELPKTIDLATIKTLLADVKWEGGTVERGAVAFKTFQCASCHSGAALGPDLKGASKRFSRDDLFAAIIDPARDVAPAYKPLLILTKDGKTRTGFLTFESAEGIILQTGLTAVERISSSDMEGRRPADGSLMPNNLLQGAKAQDYADLYAFLNSL